MSAARLRRRAFWCPALLLGCLLFAACALGKGDEPADPGQLLAHADKIKTIDHPRFVQIINDLGTRPNSLQPAQLGYLRFLEAWQVAYSGDYDLGGRLLTQVIDKSDDPVLRFRATATLINILGIGHRYDDAFARLAQLLDQLPSINDATARFQGLGEAAQVLIAAGQYDQAASYAEQMIADYPKGETTCKGMFFKLHALFKSGRLQTLSPEFAEGVNTCVGAGEVLVANTLRADIAAFDIQQGASREAIALLQANYADVRRDQYPSLMSQFDALMAQAYWETGDSDHARKSAISAINMSIKSEYTEPLSIAYDVLYRIAKEEGNTRAALDYHEQFMAADKGHLNDITARTLAYQMVRQQVEDKKIQLFDLSRRNQILQLQQELDREAVKTSRTYIVALLVLLASIGFLLYRLRRSQLRFMHLARRDGLTGICNRQHFVEEATHALRYSAKSSRSACLILIDLDHFKTINDTHGHAVGDHVLKRTVAVCQRYLRSRDVFGRLGGEEFGILFPECGAEQALARAEEIRQAIAEVPLDRDAGHVMVTASLGVASAERSGYNLHRLMVDADDALYRAKREGRNRVATASSAASGRAPGDLEISYAGELG